MSSSDPRRPRHLFYVAYAFSRGFGSASVYADAAPSAWEHVEQFRDTVAELADLRAAEITVLSWTLMRTDPVPTPTA